MKRLTLTVEGTLADIREAILALSGTSAPVSLPEEVPAEATELRTGPGRRRLITDGDRAKAAELLERGLTVRELAQAIGVHEVTAWRLKKAWKDGGGKARPPR